jgi:talin
MMDFMKRSNNNNNNNNNNNGTNGTKNGDSFSVASSVHSLASSMSNGALISLKINIVDSKIVKTLQFHPTTLVFDALRIIREKIPETNTPNLNDYGIFIPNSDATKGTWLDNNRSLDYYLLKNGDTINYCNKYRKLNIRILDGTVKTLMVDDSQTVGQLMIFICSQMCIANYEEYSIIHDIPASEKDKTLTLRKNHGDKTLTRDHKKMEELKRKLHTDDDIAWLDHSKTLREQGIDERASIILKRKFFFSDKNIDTRDPVQLNLLYVQCRDAILNGTHPISEEEAIKFAAIQCQVKYGDFNEKFHRSGCLE